VGAQIGNPRFHVGVSENRIDLSVEPVDGGELVDAG
jgi:hypothetical protein